MKLKVKIALSMFVISGIFSIALIVALVGMRATSNRFATYLEQDEALLQSVTNMYAQGLQMGQALRNIVLDPATQAAYKNLDNAGEEFSKLAREASTVPTSPEISRSLREIGELRERQVPYQKKIIELSKSSQAEAIQVLNKEETPLWRQIRGKLLEIIKIKNEEVVQLKADTLSLTSRMLKISLGLALFALIAGTVIALWLIRSVMRQVGGEPDYAVNIAQRIADGDLTVHVQLDKGDQSSLLHAMNVMKHSLQRLVSQVQSGALSIDQASKEIAEGNLNLSQRTEQQAGSLEETAASMEELTSTVKSNAANAQQANKLVNSASDIAQQGGAVVSQVIETMGSINEFSKRIVDIISIIDGIAFQTNILALNAAVEAARAGEQGRGFAVVASEVRSLAQRSAAAAKEIKDLINESVENVETGSRLVDQAGVTMSEVVNSVKQVAEIISEITVASREQTIGIEQINSSIINIDDVTQQNAALVEQVAATAETLQEQAHGLNQLIDVFKVDRTPKLGVG